MKLQSCYHWLPFNVTTPDTGGAKQFSNTPQVVNFTTVGSNETVPVHIPTLDNLISGPTVQFVCIVELVDPSQASTVNITSAVTLVRIIENDRKLLEGGEGGGRCGEGDKEVDILGRRGKLMRAPLGRWGEINEGPLGEEGTN